MAFRADEAIIKGKERAVQNLVPHSLTGKEKREREDFVLELTNRLGNVVDAYPSWHPLVSHNQDERCPNTIPNNRCGYKRLKHTVHFMNGFVTCPYNNSQEVIHSVESFPNSDIFDITAERLNVELYDTGTEPVLVECHWNLNMQDDGMIPKRLAVAMMLETEVPCWRNSDYGETWETMRPYFLGCPHGSRSSLFVDQEAGQAMKKVWNSIINTGMYGPIIV